MTLGTIPTSASNQGWQTWNWCPLQNNGAEVPVTLSGVETLRITSAGNVNANYFMLVPVQSIDIKAATAGANTVVSFPTVAGSSYSVLYSTSLTGPWSLLSTVSGSGATKSVTDPRGAGARFYKVTSP